MIRGSRLRRIGAALALCGTFMTLPRAQAQALAPADPAAAVDVIDVAVENHMLVGEVRTPQGQLLAGQHVRVMYQGSQIAATNTASDGGFTVLGVREGVHEVICCDRVTNIRIWTKETAPPQSVGCVCLVCDECAAPACQPCNPPPRPLGPIAQAFACYPVASTLIAAGIGAAIAIPIATGQKPASP